MGALYQSTLEIIPNFVVDIHVIANAERTMQELLALADEGVNSTANNTLGLTSDSPAVLLAQDGKNGVHWFWISFCISVVELLLLCFITVRQINEVERRKPLPNR